MFIIPVAETVKNTVEFLNEIYATQDPVTKSQWLIIFKFSGDLLKNWVIYILTFQWIFDFIKYPIYVVSESENIFSDLFNNFIVNKFPIDLSFSSFELNFNPFENNNIFLFLNGFLNCFFFYLPFSPVQLIWLRRMLIEGERSGQAATIGLICGNLSFLGFCLFGFREFINLWFSLECLSYFLSICLIFAVIYEMATYPSRNIIQVRNRQLWKVTATNFFLVWTDQPGLYQFIGNLSLFPGVTTLDFSSTNRTIIFYLLGVTIGSFCWTYLISFVFLNCSPVFLFLFQFIPKFIPKFILKFIPKFILKFIPLKYTYLDWLKNLNQFCLIGCITLILTNLPFYGFDYLFANSLGFNSQDSVWEGSPLFIKLKATSTDARTRGRLGEKSSYNSVDTDFSLFDRGRYTGGPPVECDIESLNYKKEYAWRSRFDRISSRNLSKTGGLFHQYLNEQLGPIEDALKKQRSKKRKTEQIQRVQKIRKQKINQNLYINDSPSLYDIDIDFVNFNDLLIERFIEDYTAEANKLEEEVPDLSDERMIQFSALSEIAKYGFDLFSIFEITEGDPFDDEVVTELKQKYSDNLIYKFFINLDIRNFMRRQYYRLSPKDEIELFKNRLALSEYYDTLRSYLKVPTNLESLFCGPKSYSNRIYNQQFKGTLKIVERLFSVNLEIDENIPILEFEKQKEPDTFLKDFSVLKFDQPLYKKDLKNPLLHEQLIEDLPSLLNEVNSIPFINEEKPLPFFIGWDNENRQFVVTNRFLTNETTLTNTTLPNKNIRKFFIQKQKKKTNNNINFIFTTWPISNKEAFYTNLLLNRSYLNRGELNFAELDGDDLFEYAEPPMEENTIIYETLPTIVRRVDLKTSEKLNTSLIPLRGGFVWPGNLPLKFKIKEQFITPLLKKLSEKLSEKFSLSNFNQN